MSSSQARAESYPAISKHLCVDVYGRGYSEAPKLPCDPNLCIIQLALLLQYVGWDATDVVGFSMVRIYIYK